MTLRGWLASLAWLAVLLPSVSAKASDGTPPPSAACAAASDAGRSALSRRTRLAAYYELKLAVVDGQVYEWQRAGQRLRAVLPGPMPDAMHVAVGKTHGYALDSRHRVLGWAQGSKRIDVLLEDVALVSAGASGLLAIKCDGTLWQRMEGESHWTRSAEAAVHAWVGDGADYYVDPGARVWARGRAHRGQYGNGQLTEAPGWTAVAEEAVRVAAHTGHALYLRKDGTVLGTGGNIHGPLSTHGHGDKAVRWGAIFEGARLLASGSRHSLAVRADGGLWIWGARAGLQPRRALQNAVDIAAGQDDSLAFDERGRLWHWRVGEAPGLVALP